MNKAMPRKGRGGVNLHSGPGLFPFRKAIRSWCLLADSWDAVSNLKVLDVKKVIGSEDTRNLEKELMNQIDVGILESIVSATDLTAR